MAEWQTTRYQKDGRVATITLNRPDKLNAINDTLFHDSPPPPRNCCTSAESWMGGKLRRCV